VRTETRRLLAPRWLAWHAALVAALVAFGLLGAWQLEGFRDAGSGAPATRQQDPAALADVLRPGGALPDEAVGRRVRAVGRYDGSSTLLVPGRTDGGREGFLVLTPLRSPGGVLAVNRGWVPATDVPAVVPPSGEVTVTGVVRRSEEQAESRVDPFAELPDGQVPYVSTVLLLDRLPYDPDDVYDGYLSLQREAPTADAVPVPVASAPDGGAGRWRSLGYALQWWFFGAAAVFFWWAVIRRSLREGAAPT
jgi:cytochrome oxidase assembly protein ShyY1